MSSLPAWFQRWGIGAWLVVRMVLVVIGAVWLLEKTSSIVAPLIAGFVVGAVSGALVNLLEHKGWPRTAGAGVVTLLLFALTVLLVGLVLGGISSQASHIDTLLASALTRSWGWAQDLGITSASDAANEIKQAVPDLGRTLLKGVAGGISGLASLLVFLGFTVFTTFFLLKDAPTIGRWIERHMGLQPAQASVVMSDIIQEMRRYFLGLNDRRRLQRRPRCMPGAPVRRRQRHRRSRRRVGRDEPRRDEHDALVGDVGDLGLDRCRVRGGRRRGSRSARGRRSRSARDARRRRRGSSRSRRRRRRGC